jgi:hypothetical protein
MKLLLVAILAGGWAFFHLGMATFAGFVSELFAEAFDLAAGFGGMTFGAVTGNLLLVSLVVELYASFELEYVRGKGGSGKSYNGNQGYYDFFHFCTTSI